MSDPWGKQVSPWLSIWYRPRATMQRIIETNPKHWIPSLICLGGISTFLERASMQHAGDKYGLTTILFGAMLFGPLSGGLIWHVGSRLLLWTGQWLGGKGKLKHIRSAIAWSYVPTIMLLFCSTCPQIALFGREMFRENTPRIDSSLFLSSCYYGFFGLGAVVGAWGFVIWLKCLGQAQGFSVWRSLGNIALSVLILWGAALCIALPFLIIYGLN